MAIQTVILVFELEPMSIRPYQQHLELSLQHECELPLDTYRAPALQVKSISASGKERSNSAAGSGQMGQLEAVKWIDCRAVDRTGPPAPRPLAT